MNFVSSISTTSLEFYETNQARIITIKEPEYKETRKGWTHRMDMSFKRKYKADCFSSYNFFMNILGEVGGE